MIEAIFFDVGGVLLRTQTWAFRTAWDDHLNLEHGTVEYLYFNSPEGKATQRGETTESNHWLWLQDKLSLSAVQLDQLKIDFWAGDKLDGALVDLLWRLKADYRLAIISNYADGLRATLRDEFKIIDAFEEVIISAEFGTLKPDKAIYLHALERMGVSAENSVFIDDFMHNIEGCQAVGMHGIHYPPSKDVNDLIDDFRAKGVNIPE